MNTTGSVMMDLNSKKQQILLDTARLMFWKHGFRRVSVQEICDEAKVSKMTFYRFFPNKIAIAKAVFEREADNGLRQFRAIINEKSSPPEKIRKIILLKRSGVNEISREFLQDFYSSPELGLKQFIDEKTRSTWNIMLKDFKKAQRNGTFRKDMKPEFLFFLSQKIGELLNDPWLSQQYKNPQDMVMELANFFAFGISPRGK